MTNSKNKIYDRNKLIWGEESQNRLLLKHVAVFGLGGVGSYAAEALARAGVGKITVIDFDEVSETNINRQLLALNSTIGKKKAVLMRERIKDINDNITVNVVNDFSTKDLTEKILEEPLDYVIDAIDTLRSKIDLLEICFNKKIPVISSFGAGNRLDPEQLFTADISEIKSPKCPFAKNIINRLKKRNINQGITVVLSTEKPAATNKELSHIEITTESGENIEFKKFTPGSSPFVPPVAGYIMASYAVRQLINR